MSLSCCRSCPLLAASKTANPAVPSVIKDSFKAITADDKHTCGIRDDDKVVCWGENRNGLLPTSPSVDSFKALSSGEEHICGTRTDDKFLCWGHDDAGRASRP